MRVGLLGNMNNNFFALARFLRDRGVDAELLLFPNETIHFHPSADTYDLGYQAYCRSLPWGEHLAVRSTPAATIRRDLDRYDVLFGCGAAPAYCDKAGRRLDFFVPYAGDIYNMTFYKLIDPRRLRSFWHAVHRQRRGIATGRVFQMDLGNEIYESRYRALHGQSERWAIGVPMVYTGIYSPERIGAYRERSHWWHAFASLRQEHELVVFSHMRHAWTYSKIDHKGNDSLLKGWALFRARRPRLRACLATLEYGRDVEASRRLAQDLGVGESVRWFPAMFRKDLMMGISVADVVCGEFTNSWVSYGVTYEAMAMAKPLLMYREDEAYRDRYPDLYPIMNARTPEQIAARLEELVDSPARFRAVGEAGRAWYDRFVVQEALDRYLSWFDANGGEARSRG